MSETKDIMVIETVIEVNRISRNRRFTLPIGSSKDQIEKHIKTEVIKEEKQIMSGSSFEVEL